MPSREIYHYYYFSPVLSMSRWGSERLRQPEAHRQYFQTLYTNPLWQDCLEELSTMMEILHICAMAIEHLTCD